ncbi:MAG: ABC transporter permease subunit [Actinomycetota bacterium]|nr:ABC transporter permease subunit [Actinomycetota bacterium]
MTTTAATSRPPAAPIPSSLPARLIPLFSGTAGLVIKIVLLAVANALAIWAGAILAGDGRWVALAILAATTLALDAVYLRTGRAVPLKFLVPGTIFLIAFSIVPIAYNVNVAFTNWSTGHLLTKDEAIDGIRRSSLVQPADSSSYVMAPARDAEGELVLVLVDEATGQPFVGTRDGLEPLPPDSVTVDELGLVATAKGYELAKGPALLALDAELRSFRVPTGDGAAIRPEGLELAVELRPTLRYDARTDTFVGLENGKVYRDNGRGAFVAADGTELEPGWRTGVGAQNFRRLGSDPLIRKPFVRVLVWTFFFATATVLLSFTLGLFLAIALNKPKMRFMRTYRSLLVLPYAVPAFLSILVWRGLLNDEFGLVNRLLPFDVPWLFDASWAKVSVIVVSLWLTFPYFFLVALGALQSVPDELVEAARVDGGGPWQIFRRITLPLLLVAVAPLLIASFAFNFNNFNNIYLLTEGGPPAEDQIVAGGTDILISYTWKLAFEGGKGQDYGLASAISIVIFLIVASVSAVSFWRSKSLEEMR